jgi:hypothetical protein
MTVLNQSELKQEFSKWKPDRIAEIIDKLAGGKSNLRVDIQDIRLTIGDKQYELAGQVHFNVIHKNRKSSYEPMILQEQCDDDVPGFESGRVFISTGDLEVLRISVVGRRLDLDVEDKQFMKRVMKLRNEINSMNPETREKKAEKKKPNPFAMVRTIADTCKKLGITLTISYKGHRIATLGTEAKPTSLQLVTKTRAVAINSLYTAIEMMI